MNGMSDERLGVRIDPPDPICTETPAAREARRHGKRPTADEVRASVRADFQKKWPGITREIQSVQGFGKHANVKVD
jgi:hypothetical protein